MTLMSAPTTGRGRRGIMFVDRLMRTARPFGVAVGYVWVTLIYIPIVWLAVMSVSSRPLTGVPYPLSLEWYDALFSGDMRWLPPLERSLILGLIVSVLCMVSATMVGRVLPQLRRRGGLLAAFLAPLFVPALVTGVSMFMFYRALIGLKLGDWSLVLAHFVWAFPFATAGDARGLVAFRHPHERGRHPIWARPIGSASGRSRCRFCGPESSPRASSAFSCPSTSCRSASTCGRAK